MNYLSANDAVDVMLEIQATWDVLMSMMKVVQ